MVHLTDAEHRIIPYVILANQFVCVAWFSEQEKYQELFETNTLARLKVQAWLIDHLKLLKEGTMALAVIPRSVELELGATEDDMDNISSIPRTIVGVKVAATLRESPEGDVKLSVRAVPDYDAAALAKQFGGGGHTGAAGAHIRMKLDQVCPMVEQALMEL